MTSSDILLLIKSVLARRIESIPQAVAEKFIKKRNTVISIAAPKAATDTVPL
jgi:hypothetical protein